MGISDKRPKTSAEELEHRARKSSELKQSLDRLEQARENQKARKLVRERLDRGDIQIGDDSWIEFADLTGRLERAVDIDPIILSVAELWDALETVCVVDCCGLDAFNFLPEAIEQAKQLIDAETVNARLQEIENKIFCLETDVVLSNRLNNYCDKRVFLHLLQHIQCHLRS